MGKVAPRSPKLNCPTAHSPEEETQVLMSCPDQRRPCAAWQVRQGQVGRALLTLPRHTDGSAVGEGSALQFSCLENPMDRGAWRATIHGVAKSGTQLSDFHFQEL